jgi:hypothetical protein
MSDSPTERLPEWVTDALHEAPPSTARAREAIMDRIRSAAPPRRGTLRPMTARWARRGLLSSSGLTMGLLLILASASARQWSPFSGPALLAPIVRILGDSIVPIAGTPIGESLLDTMWVVDVVMRGASIRSAALVMHGRDASPLAMRELRDGEWHARVLTPPDVLPVAVVVNDLRVVPITRAVQRADTL